MSFSVNIVFNFLNCATINNQSSDNILLPFISNYTNILDNLTIIHNPIPIRSYYSTLLDENDMSKYQYIHL